MSGLPIFIDGVPSGMRFKFETIQREACRPEFIWSLANEHGGIHISAWRDSLGYERWMGGIECHWASPPDYYEGTEPHHDHCWLLGKPCWHDGSSLYFSERIADVLPREGYVFDDYVHRSMLSEMRRWHRDKISTPILTDQVADSFEGEGDRGK